ncbi:MAG: hypothetical protein ACLUI7_06925 [Coprococcus sp.]
MKTAERRNAILKLLQNAESRCSEKLAERGVSRQVLFRYGGIRAYTGDISTTKVMDGQNRAV